MADTKSDDVTMTEVQDTKIESPSKEKTETPAKETTPQDDPKTQSTDSAACPTEEAKSDVNMTEVQKTKTESPSKEKTDSPTDETKSDDVNMTEVQKIKTESPSKEKIDSPTDETKSDVSTSEVQKIKTESPSKEKIDSPMEQTKSDDVTMTEVQDIKTEFPSKEKTETPAKETTPQEDPKTQSTDSAAGPTEEEAKLPATENAAVNDDVAHKSSETKVKSEDKDAVNGLTEAAAVAIKTEATPQLNKSIIQQIEYYFGNYNLPRDKFLSAEVKKDDGWVALTTMLNFARLAKLTTDTAIVAAAIMGDQHSFMEVDESNSKIRRSTTEPLPEMSEGLQEESLKRTIYCKGFPKDGSITLDGLLEFFKQFGEYDSVKMRNYLDKSEKVQGFKGSVLVVFKTAELAKKFLEGPSVQYTKQYLLRKWFSDYLDEKRTEFEERKSKKQARLDKESTNGTENKAPQSKEFEELPRGNFLRATGFAEKTSREDIKEAVILMTNDCAFVDFRKGDTEAYIRFSKADSNKEILSALKNNLKVNGATLELFLVEGEEEDTQHTKANEARRKVHDAGPFVKKRKHGGYGGRGGRGKRQRRN